MTALVRRLAFALLMLACGAASAELAVTAEGAVLRPGPQRLAAGARLLDVVRAAGVRSDAYLLGAAWLHDGELAAQRELKAGLLFDLGALERSARLDGDAGLAALAARLNVQISAMPVTGRRVNTLDPLRLELEPRSNRPLADRDRLLFPPRPATVTVTGAVTADCELPFVGLRAAAEYAADCPRAAGADSDWLLIVQPDGQVQRRGIALWNRDPRQPIAPGARVVVPLRAAVLQDLAEQLNDDLAAFLATQPLPLGEATR